MSRAVLGLREMLHTPPRFALRLATARLRAQWRSLLTLIAGTILSAAIGALVPLYTTAIAQVGMTQRLADEPAQDVHVQAAISLRASDWAESGGLAQKAEQATALVRHMAARDLGVIPGWVDALIPYIETAPTGLAQQLPEAETPEPLVGVRARLAYYQDWPHYVRLVSGRWPEDTPDDTVEVVLSLQAATELNLDVGADLILDQGLDERGRFGGGHPTSRPIRAQIVGVVAPLDAEAPYWMSPSPLRLLDKLSGSGVWDYDFVFLTTREAAFRAATANLPDTPTKIGWRVLFAHDNLPFARLDEARAALRIFEHNMRAAFVPPPPTDEQISSRQDLGFSYHTRLIDYDLIHRDRDDGILLDYAKRQELLSAPFGLLLLQIGALVLFFLMVTAALVRRGERREIALLQSRGAWDSQILLLRGIEALIIAALATAVAPLLARELLTALGPRVANTEDFPLPLSGDAFLYAGAAAGVTFLALTLSLWPVLKLPLILAGGAAARSEKQPWWQRYYVDVVLALVGLGALWQMVRVGSPLADVNLGGKQADPLMLLAPSLLFVALGSLALRFFPLLARAASWAASAGRGLVQALATWQLSREPVHYGRITFLLALAVGIGWFATSFRATVTNSHLDQARYRVGTDVRLTERDARLNVNRARPQATYQALEGVQAASVAYRLDGVNLSASLSGDLRGTLLAIDPRSFGQTLYWRDDLGPVYSPHAPDVPLALPERGQVLPSVPARIGVWARFEVNRPGVEGFWYQASVNRLVRQSDLGVRLLDASGAWLRAPLRVVEIEYQRVGRDAPGFQTAAFVPSGWVYMEADLTALNTAPQAPLRLVSFYWTYRSASSRGERGMRLTLADLTLIDADGQATPYPIFDRDGWEFLYDRGATAKGEIDTVRLPSDTARGDALFVKWAQEAQRSTVGVVLNYPAIAPLDAVLSRRVLEQNGLVASLDAPPFTLVNVAHTAVQFRPVLVTDYYPSLYDTPPTDADPRGDAFMVVDARELLYWLNRRPSVAYYADEVWLRLSDALNPTDRDAVHAFVEKLTADDGDVVLLQSVTLADELRKLRTDPLALGLLGLMYLAFVVALTLSVVGLLTYAALTTQARRAEFGVLRALGLSALRVVQGLALEQLFVMGVGVALGALLGGVLAWQVVPTLALGAAGEGVTPPFVMRVGARRLLEYAALMGGVLGLVLASSLLLVRQLSIARTLRLGDE